MLTVKRTAAAVTTAVLVLSVLVLGAAAPAASADGCKQVGLDWVCPVEVTNPGSPGGPNPGAGTGPADFTPGPSSCIDKNAKPEPVEVPCSNGAGWFDNDRQCYWTLDDPQRTAAGRDPSQGAFYSCTPLPSACAGLRPESCFGISVWLDSPPPGVQQYTPAQAAGKLAKSFVLSPIQIGMAPALKTHADDPAGTAPYRRTWVGIPVWLWVDQPSESTWGPTGKTATLGGVTVTATAKAQAVYWSSGDGQNVTCQQGTAFDEAVYANQAAVDSPSCGWRYQHTSKGGTFTVTAATAWVVEWSGGGQNGTIQMPTVSTSTDVRVGELQSVNVVPPSGGTPH